MLLKLEEQCPGTPIEVLLSWANMARNALQMWHGFSSYQLVFGQNPNLPNIMTDHLPAYEGSTNSETLVHHLNALHASRTAFIQSEADERIRRPLRNKVRASEQNYVNGDRVYYKREGNDRWLGPGKVVFQDGKVVFVRHGGVFVRVSPNRLIKFNEELDPHKNSSNARGSTFTAPIQDKVTVLKETIGNPNPIPATSHMETEKLAPKNFPNKNDAIEFKVAFQESWTHATVLGRAGKATGKHKDWVNIKLPDGEKTCINLQDAEWRSSVNHSDVNVVMVPKSRHSEIECLQAKQTEIQKLQEFQTYEEIKDVGQFKISTTWVLSEKGEEIRARLVARGYEEMTAIQSDSPTVNKWNAYIFSHSSQ